MTDPIPRVLHLLRALYPLVPPSFLPAEYPPISCLFPPRCGFLWPASSCNLTGRAGLETHVALCDVIIEPCSREIRPFLQGEAGEIVFSMLLCDGSVVSSCSGRKDVEFFFLEIFHRSNKFCLYFFFFFFTKQWTEN